MNKWIGLILLLTLSIGCETTTIDSSLIQSIPDHSKVVIALSDLQDVEDLMQNNPLFNQLNDLSRVKELKKASSFLKKYDLKSQSFVALSMEGKNQTTITLLTDSYRTSSDSTSIVNKVTYNGIDISERSTENATFFTADKNGTHIASSSILVVESLIRRELENYVFDSAFARLFERTQNDLSIYINAADEEWLYQYLLGNNKTSAKNFASWYQLEVDNDGQSISFDGLLIYQDSLKQKQKIYNDLKAQPNQLDKIAPASFNHLTSITYADHEVLKANIANYHATKLQVPELLNFFLKNSQEISMIQLDSASATVFTIKSYEDFSVNLDSLSSEKVTYRDQEIYTLSNSLALESLNPLMSNQSLSKMVLIDNFVVLSSSIKAVEDIIANYQNGTTLSNQNWWKESRKKISDSSTLLKITSLARLATPNFKIDDQEAKVLNKIEDNTVRAIISQYVHEDGYAFYRMEIPYATTAADQPLVAQMGSYKSERNIIAGPFLFPNHVNNTFDVAFQTDDFTLTLVSESGTEHWSKKLDAKILGVVNAVDVYKNGRQQLLFSTTDKVYLLDRTGEDVDKFPFDPKKKITQPLSVFDYDNNHDYRFVVTTGKNLTMLDAKGNLVKGFKYKADGEIVNSPQHFRKGNKDYIAFTTDKNELKLLSRTGGMRTNVKTKIETRSPLYFNNNLIQLVSVDDKLLHVNPSTGKVTTTKTSLDADSQVSFTSRSQLIQNKNVLQINGNKTSLPYGSYLPASITRVNNKDYVSVIDTGEKKVYIIDNQGEILPFLPVYGSEAAQIDGGKSRYLVTLDENEVLIYKW